MRNKIELLAPAGDMERLEMAVAYGADAVYLAGTDFGMRSFAGNFSRTELKQAVDLCRSHRVRVHVTCNTMPRNQEVARLPEWLEYLHEVGVDAIILADVGTLALARRHAPKVQCHISTQASIVNYQSAQAWHDLGASRVILARELSLEEIQEIRAKTPKELEIEVFAHGAMCVSYSGRCLLSNYMTGRDSNRGECAQPCRYQYALMEEKRPGEYFPVYEENGQTYIMNSKDMCMIEHVPELIEAGITSFKIEGRNKTAYYAACVTGAYRAAIDTYKKDPENFVLPQFCRDEVNKVSHREYYTGFYFGNQENGQHYGDSQYIREYEVVGMPVECDDSGKAVFALKNRFFDGEELELIQPGQAPYTFCAKNVTDDEGTERELFNVPQMRVHFAFPFKVSEWAILRKVKERPE